MFLEGILDLVYPRRCAVCGGILPFEAVGLCEECKDMVTADGGIVIKTPSFQSTKILSHITEAYSVFPYETVKRGIEDFKFLGVRDNGKYLGIIMYRVAQARFSRIFRDRDMIVYVPIHPAKERERGFNQAEIMAQEISRLSGVPIARNKIRRRRNTQPQSGLNMNQRVKNVKDAFTVPPNSVEGRRILLIDDINSTGVTLNECAKALLGGGAESVIAYTLAAAVLEAE